jgi:hypothetical protein
MSADWWLLVIFGGEKKDYQLGRELAPIEIVCCAVGKKEESLHISLSTKGDGARRQ